MFCFFISTIHKNLRIQFLCIFEIRYFIQVRIYALPEKFIVLIIFLAVFSLLILICHFQPQHPHHTWVSHYLPDGAFLWFLLSTPCLLWKCVGWRLKYWKIQRISSQVSETNRWSIRSFSISRYVHVPLGSVRFCCDTDTILHHSSSQPPTHLPLWGINSLCMWKYVYI